jgi:flagellar biosynthetic protein FlhB
VAEYSENSSDDKTEEPSAYRLEELRRKGQVPYSKEVASTAAFLVVVGSMYGLSQGFTESILNLMKVVFTEGLNQQIPISSGLEVFDVVKAALITTMVGLLPMLVGTFVVVVLVSLVQTQGLVVSTESLKFDLQKVNPLNGIKKLFSSQSLFQGAKSVLKSALILAILYYSVLDDIQSLSELSGAEIGEILRKTTWLAGKVCLYTGMFMVFVSALDYLFQWWTFNKQARMTKQEAKQEHKEREGDPLLKSRMRSTQREMARKRMMKAVPKADVIITNPTHFAVAIVYEKDLMAPKVLAKGADLIAKRIREIATEHGVPIVENKPLARALYKNVKVGQMIPRSFYQAIAEILAYVYRIKPKRVFSEQEDISQY